MGEIALALIFQLREPGTPGLGEPGECEDQEKKRRQVMNKIRAIFGLKPLPEEAEGEEEEPEDEEEMNPGLQTALESQQDAEAPGTDAGSSSDAGQALARETNVVPGVIPAHAPPKPDATDSEAVVEPNPYAKISKEEWKAREPVRQLLENTLTHQVEIYKARRQALLKELVAGSSLYERAAETTPRTPT